MLFRCLRLEHRSRPLIDAVIIGLTSGAPAAGVTRATNDAAICNDSVDSDLSINDR